MHEMSLIEGVMRVLEEQAAVQGFSQVRAVWLEIGELSSVEPEALMFCFQAIQAGSLAEGARLEIVRTPGQAYCLDCGKPVHVASRTDNCPLCGSGMVQVIGGDRMLIKQLEVE
jgi:hydrogenase nickel incorporation protein HypA/HybF